MIDLSWTDPQGTSYAPPPDHWIRALPLAGPSRFAPIADGSQVATPVLANELALIEMVARGLDLTHVLASLCVAVERDLPGSLCSVYVADWNGVGFRRVVAPSLRAEFGQADRLPTNDHPIGPGPETASPDRDASLFGPERDQACRTSPRRSLASLHGLSSCRSFPIQGQPPRVLGYLVVFQRAAMAPDALQPALVERATTIAGMAIERARHEASLRRSEAYLAEAQRLSAVGSFCWRVSTGEIIWSAQMHRIFAIEPGQPITLDLIAGRIHAEDLPKWFDLLASARAGAPGFESQHRLTMPDDTVKYVHLVARAVENPDGEPEYIGAVQDVTQRRLSEHALDKARSELAHVTRVVTIGALTASVAHEVSQPITSIIANAGTCLRMLAAEPPNLAGASETARRTLRDGTRAADVIIRLRALFSRTEVSTEPVDLNETLQEVLALSASELQRSQVVVRTSFADALPPVRGDRVQLQQVMLNLILNAAAAMDGVDARPRHLVIRTEQRDGVRVSVEDSGAGFEPHTMERLFEPFFTTKSEGMGMGLSVSRSIIESHHGRLWASLNDGPGATFSFCLPTSVERRRAARSLGASR